MNEQQVSDLLTAMTEQIKAQSEQTKAMNRLAESNEALAAVMYQAFSDEIEEASSADPSPTYLSGKPRG